MVINNNINCTGSSSSMKQTSYVSSLSVSCSGFGNDQMLGHPTIYLKIAPNMNYVSCPYCSKRFIYKE